MDPGSFYNYGTGYLECGVPKIRGTLLGVLIIRTIIYWGLYCGNDQMDLNMILVII